MLLNYNDFADSNMEILDELYELVIKNNQINPEFYKMYDVKRGLRNSDGTGVLVGLTEIGDVQGYVVEDGVKKPIEGKLLYRGIDVWDLIRGFQKEKRFGYEETCYLLLFGELPNEKQLNDFTQLLGENRKLPDGFTEDMI